MDPERCRSVTQSSLCTTIGGRDVPLLTITAPESHDEEEGVGGGGGDRRVGFISARVPPGETPARLDYAWAD